MASYLLGATLGRAAEPDAIAHASATVFMPAGARGAAGADELHQQVVHLLNFKTPPTGVFEEQVAFNVTMARAHGAQGYGLAQAVSAEAAALAGLDGKLTVSLVQAPVFHGYAASIWLELEEAVAERTLAARFRDPPFATDTKRGARAPSPVSVAESNLVHVGPIRRAVEAARPGYWIWVVADTTSYDSGAAAIELAKSALG